MIHVTVSTRATLVAALVAATMLVGCGRAVTSIVAPDESFSLLDANQDGRLSREESRLLPSAFAGLDRDGNGQLSELEWRGGVAIDTNTAAQIQDYNEAARSPRPVGPGTW